MPFTELKTWNESWYDVAITNGANFLCNWDLVFQIGKNYVI